MTVRTIENRDLLATFWTWSGDAVPAIGDESSPLEIRDRLEAVAEAGWAGVGFTHGDLMKLKETIGLAELKNLLDAFGIRKVELEFITNWWTDGELRRVSDQIRRDIFEASPVLGVNTIKIGPELTAFGVENPVERGRFAAEFDALATEAGSHGLRVAVEPMPMANITTVIEGAQLVREVDNPHAGLVLDVWHVVRAGTTYAEMARGVDIDKVFIVEIDDADEHVNSDLWEDTIHHRRLPGDGYFDPAGFIATLYDLGWRSHWGVEIISAVHRKLPIKEATRVAYEATIAAFDRAETLDLSAS